jgi:hypothetical protein
MLYRIIPYQSTKAQRARCKKGAKSGFGQSLFGFSHKCLSWAMAMAEDLWHNASFKMSMSHVIYDDHYVYDLMIHKGYYDNNVFMKIYQKFIRCRLHSG